MLCVIVVVAMNMSLAPRGDAAPSVTAYGKLPALSQLELSPDGKHLASIRPYKGEKILVVQNLEGKGLPPVLIQTIRDPDSNDEITSFFWANNDRIVIFIQGLRFARSKDGRQLLTQTEIIGVNRDASNMKVLSDLDKGSAPREWGGIIDLLRDDPDNVLILGWNSGYEGNAYKLNVNNGRLAPVIRGTYAVYRYYTDHTGEPRIRYNWDFSKEEGFAYFRNPGSLNWQRVFNGDDDDDYGFVDFTSDPNTIVAAKRNDKGWTELYNYKLNERTFGPMLRSFEGKEFGGILTDWPTGSHIGYSAAEDYFKAEYSEPQRQQIVTGIEAALPGQRVVIADMDRARRKFVIATSTERDPTTYYLYDAETGRMAGLGSQYPSLEGKPGYEVRKIVYTARDGMTIPAYLTVPQAPGPYKTVILPHGGPLVRDYMTFDTWAQALASQGYAVLQPNYRGSTGLGKKHEKAGHGEWGLKMHDDVIDGTRFLIDQGIAQRDHICIAGWSYGGYAAIRAATLNDDKLFRCAVVGAAVVDVEDWLKLVKFKIGTNEHDAIGSLRWDKDKIREISPINAIDKVNIPVLVVHGEYDARVGPKEGKRLAKALKPTGHLYKYIELEKGDHNMSREVNRVKFLEEMAAFLEKKL